MLGDTRLINSLRRSLTPEPFLLVHTILNFHSTQFSLKFVYDIHIVNYLVNNCTITSSRRSLTPEQTFLIDSNNLKSSSTYGVFQLQFLLQDFQLQFFHKIIALHITINSSSRRSSTPEPQVGLRFQIAKYVSFVYNSSVELVHLSASAISLLECVITPEPTAIYLI